MKKKTELTTLVFDFDGLKIVSSVDDFVVVKARLGWNGRKDRYLVIHRLVFIDMLNEWLKRKEDYFNRYDHFCGVGCIECEAEQFDTCMYECVSYFIQMEHG